MTALALHERIRTDFEGRILSGALQPGARIPVEHELMQLYGCSRMTVSKALSALSSAGLIERNKRAGSVVARPKVHSMILDVPDLPVEVAARGQAYRFQLLSRKVRPPVRGRPDEIALAGAGQLLELRGLHFADTLPLALEDRLVSLAAVPQMGDADLAVDPPGSWLLRAVPWTEAETKIAAVNCDAKTARLLQITPGAACLSVDRSTWRAHERITSVRQLFVGIAYDLVARIGHYGGSVP